MKNPVEVMRSEKNVVVFIHGILGHPGHFNELYGLVPKSWDMVKLVLAGHCGGVRDLSKTTMKEWKRQIKNELDVLQREGKNIYIVAHSMGTLFAINEATRRPIKGLFLLNVPLRIRITGRLIKTCYYVYRGDNNDNDRWIEAAIKACGIKLEKNVLLYAGWLPRYFELFAEIYKTNKLLEKLRCPCKAFIAIKDEMVSTHSARVLKAYTPADIIVLRESGHFYYHPGDNKRILSEFKKFITEGNI